MCLDIRVSDALLDVVCRPFDKVVRIYLHYLMDTNSNENHNDRLKYSKSNVKKKADRTGEYYIQTMRDH